MKRFFLVALLCVCSAIFIQQKSAVVAVAALDTGSITFRDVTQQAGIRFVHNNGAFGKKFLPETMGPGVAFIDYDNDGRPDIFLVNGMDWPGHVLKHSTPKLYRNNGNGTFTEKAVVAGIAFSEDGVARAGMGVDASDYDHSGAPSILITNFSNQMVSLYHNEGKGLFVDEAPRSDVGRSSLLTLGFGCFFFDYDLDGWPDIFIANGHIDRDIERVQPNVKYAMPPHLFRNLGNGTFREVANSLGKPFNTPRVGRGAAYADINNDGRPDLLLSTNGGPAYLFLNEATGPTTINKSLRIKLVGTKSNRDGIGAVVKLTAGGETQSQMLRSGSSYLSASELILTFGLAQYTQADTLEIHWPSGQLDKLSNIPAGQTITITESQGQTASRKFSIH